MKKTYIAPNTDVFQMKVGNLLAGSTDYTHDGEAGTGSSGDGNGINFGREGDFFDDED